MDPSGPLRQTIEQISMANRGPPHVRLQGLASHVSMSAGLTNVPTATNTTHVTNTTVNVSVETPQKLFPEDCFADSAGWGGGEASAAGQNPAQASGAASAGEGVGVGAGPGSGVPVYVGSSGAEELGVGVGASAAAGVEQFGGISVPGMDMGLGMELMPPFDDELFTFHG